MLYHADLAEHSSGSDALPGFRQGTLLAMAKVGFQGS